MFRIYVQIPCVCNSVYISPPKLFCNDDMLVFKFKLLTIFTKHAQISHVGYWQSTFYWFHMAEYISGGVGQDFFLGGGWEKCKKAPYFKLKKNRLVERIPPSFFSYSIPILFSQLEMKELIFSWLMPFLSRSDSARVELLLFSKKFTRKRLL